jgi:hypothetical protein
MTARSPHCRLKLGQQLWTDRPATAGSRTHIGVTAVSTGAAVGPPRRRAAQTDPDSVPKASCCKISKDSLVTIS